MPRPKKHRRVCCNPSAYYFKPRGIPVYELEEIILDHDELESLRLADLLAYSHEKAAKEMKISRATFGRIIETARKKVVDGILNGKAIRINEKELNHIKKGK
ncbi:MAG: hypothetical protein A2057_13005 [Ignavibacteria bacterium GWA2_35_9]|nr:MAG: hypothetical protein A2057_13005 [Ignavibacteria bacterium GWA2_35_9]OGU43069.1 MAG: hypothetical protein A2000_03270 [Ignavibacteria bacterium GWB2_36_8]